MNATALCQATNKLLDDYLENEITTEYLEELKRSIEIPMDQLIQKVTLGSNEEIGTWVHPQVAINLGQWASPQFAAYTSKWVFEWMQAGFSPKMYKFPYHIRRYLINRSEIPPTHFSMLDQITFKLLGALETKGYIVPINLLPDISLGRMFSKWLRDKGHDPDSFPTYNHVFDDGKRPPVSARLYPNELMTDFNKQLNEWITSGRALEYFEQRDPDSVPVLKSVIEEIPEAKEIETKNHNKP